MAIAKYKALQEFEYEGEPVVIGQELTLRDSRGETLVQHGQAVLVKYLDPDIPEEKTEIDAAQAAARKNDKTEAPKARPKKILKNKAS